MTIIEGDTGIIIIDPLTFVESAAAAQLYRRHPEIGRFTRSSTAIAIPITMVASRA
ncbi:MAG: hypothetical protein R3E83_17580 [Burkholderiaceae bacterium]